MVRFAGLSFLIFLIAGLRKPTAVRSTAGSRERVWWRFHVGVQQHEVRVVLHAEYAIMITVSSMGRCCFWALVAPWPARYGSSLVPAVISRARA